jgi:hypothetical protein
MLLGEQQKAGTPVVLLGYAMLINSRGVTSSQ